MKAKIMSLLLLLNFAFANCYSTSVAPTFNYYKNLLNNSCIKKYCIPVISTILLYYSIKKLKQIYSKNYKSNHVDGEVIFQQNDLVISKSVCTRYNDTTFYQLFRRSLKIGKIAVIKNGYTCLITNFYINPKHRNQGLGKLLLNQLINHLLKNNEQNIILEAGPFELDDHEKEIELTESEKSEKLEILKKFYNNCGFKYSENLIIKMNLLYRSLGIHAQCKYPMIYQNLNSHSSFF